jgi:2-polyprenyl-3-methyl-5-hydroxy-6-metoxy-1,4-benzoquinol methylase
LGEFTCKHLTNKYIGRTGLEKKLVEIQIEVLIAIGNGSSPVPTSIRVETFLPSTRWAKSYYEPRRDDLLALLPKAAKRILSLGCGWGLTEQALIENGVDVTAVPLDVVVGAVAATKGIQIIPVSLEEAPVQLASGSFDGILISNLLHLVDDPIGLLRQYSGLLIPGGVLVLSVPNLSHGAIWLRQLCRSAELSRLRDYHHSGVHLMSHDLMCRWLDAAGYALQRSEASLTPRWQTYNKMTRGLAKKLMADEFLFVAAKRG